MMKPPNVKSVFPLHRESKEKVKLPDEFQNAKKLVIVNAESNRGDDLLSDILHKEFLFSLITKLTVDADVRVVLIAHDTLQPPVQDRVHTIHTEDSVEKVKFELTNIDQKAVWLGSCTQRNLISAIGNHKIPMVGYAKNSHSTDQNTQKYNCNKLLEFNVGLPVELNEGQTIDNGATVKAIKFFIDDSGKDQVKFIRQHVKAFGGVLDE